MTSLGAVLIVKNEEAMLDKCLSSLEGIDKIFIVDTGSTDKTIEIAKTYTSNVIEDEYVWNDNFAEARNFAKSKADTDWILTIDADEELQPGGLEAIRKAIKTAKNAVSVVMTSTAQSFEFPRVYKNSPKILWKGAIHNHLNVLADTASGAKIVFGYSPAHSKDPDRALRILQKEVAKGVGPREIFYLAREYMYRKQWKMAITWYDIYLQQAHFAGEMAEANLQKARANHKLGNLREAQESTLEALRINANFKEAMVFMSEITGSNNSAFWVKASELCDNRHVLFVRAPKKKPVDLATVSKAEHPMDLLDEPKIFFENILKEYKKVDVLEWGAGYSTKYFPKMLEQEGIDYTWDSIEHNKGWYDEILTWNVKDVTLKYATQNSADYLIPPKKKYDVIYVDGRNRVNCLKKAKELLKPNGIVFLHDAERPRYAAGFDGYTYDWIDSGKAKLWYGRLNSIPPIIHQIWIGPEKKPTKLLNTWKKMNPEFGFMFWDEKAIDELGLVNRKVYDDYYKKKCYNGAANIARVEILKKYGGIYIDADSECLHTLKGAPFMKQDFFAVNVVDGTKRIANSPIGAVSNHHIIDNLINMHGALTELYPSHKCSGPGLMPVVIKDTKKILPAYTFLPVFFRGHKNKVEGIVYSNHLWNTTLKNDIKQP